MIFFIIFSGELINQNKPNQISSVSLIRFHYWKSPENQLDLVGLNIFLTNNRTKPNSYTHTRWSQFWLFLVWVISNPLDLVTFIPSSSILIGMLWVIWLIVVINAFHDPNNIKRANTTLLTLVSKCEDPSNIIRFT